ncbi:PKD domain-containing protein (plasmid) [Haladaptatus sp. SPP-AMP-3]|uniref:PKD domain-containing protein n=1 Tax=Haladaptatus sp. SPP-AMP-3 TaxID=3121295 RepID=UPI003C2EFB86
MTATRRTFLTAAGCAGLLGLGVTATTGESETSVSRDSYTIRSGTDQETTVFVTSASESGPTVMVVGGVHGNENGGYTAAEKVAQWDIARGTLVTIPKANAAAVEEDSRIADGGVDLNRQFPTGEEPETELARAIWGVVERFQPDAVIDLHESVGIYDGDMVGGVGQAIFSSWDDRAFNDARAAAEYINDNYVSRDGYDFTVDPFSSSSNEPTGLLTHKAARDTDAVAFLVEATSDDTALGTRVQWLTKTTQQLVEEDVLTSSDGGSGVDDGDEGDDGSDGSDGSDDGSDGSDGGDGGNDGGEQNEAPVARIRTTPSDTTGGSLERGDTVTLDASPSSDGDGEIVEYMWDIDGDGSFEESGETAEMTLSSCGRYRVTLQVTDDKGATATDEAILSVK